ncbi:MAG: BamA/TamA family outer membrane protein [Chitinispirillaceae bacterium]|nr:BamA/TamA family outer membrane protein [Chitinispirillaceae bacterium]
MGMRYDSLLLVKARRRLKETNLFFKVDLFSLKTGDGYRVYIILNEKFYLLPYDLGGEIFSYRYGKRETWVRGRLGMEYGNFRGKAEILRGGLSLWDWHSVSIGWYKPFLPSPYSFSFSVSADQLPDEVFPIDHSILRGTMAFGRKLPLSSRADISIMPLVRRRIMYDTNYITTGKLIVTDTVRVYEAFSLLRWRTDFRDRFFDPTDGWLLAFDLRSNILHNKAAPRFLQLFSDVRWYNRGLFPSHTIACRLTSILRNTDAGETHRLQLGGEGSIRGYARSQFGISFVANNSLTLSMEYRFPLIRFPDMDLYLLNQFNSVFSAISYRLDGALILDYGRVTATIDRLFSPLPDHVESGTGLGAGLRIVTPTFERSACFDLVWGTDKWSRHGNLVFIKKPMWHVYLDLFY